MNAQNLSLSCYNVMQLLVLSPLKALIMRLDWRAANIGEPDLTQCNLLIQVST
jgi:hypothetical protein